MENFKKLLLTLVLVVSVPTVALAIQSGCASATSDTALQTRQANIGKAIQGSMDLLKRYETNFRTCEPVHLNQSIDLFGLKMGYKFDINGWVDNKCSYYMTGNIGGLGNDIKEVFNINLSDETIAKVKPVVQCNFTQEQLNILVDGFMAAQERKLTSKVASTEDKATPAKEKLSPEEEKMMQMLMSGEVCTMPNQEEVMQNFSELLNALYPTKPVENGVTNEVENLPELDQIPEDEAKPILRQDAPKVNMPSAPQF